MLKNILSLSQYPNIQQDATESFTDKAATLFKAYGFVWLVILFAVAPLIAATEAFVVHVLHLKSIRAADSISFKHMFEKTGYVFGMIYVCLLGPFLEETVFRLPLSFKKNHIATGLAVAMLFIVTLYHADKTLMSSGLRIALGVLQLAIPVGTFIALKKFLPVEIKLSDNAKKRFIITSMCLFGLMHVANYSPLQWPIIWLYPIYVLPQFFMGWLMTYVRLKNGFIWGVALHCLINTTGMLLAPSYQEPAKTKSAHTITTHSKKDPDTLSHAKSK